MEYDYFGKGNGISFSTAIDTYYLFPVDQTYSVTKFHFAVEELYKIEKDKKTIYPASTEKKQPSF